MVVLGGWGRVMMGVLGLRVVSSLWLRGTSLKSNTITVIGKR